MDYSSFFIGLISLIGDLLTDLLSVFFNYFSPFKYILSIIFFIPFLYLIFSFFKKILSGG